MKRTTLLRGVFRHTAVALTSFQFGRVKTDGAAMKKQRQVDAFASAGADHGIDGLVQKMDSMSAIPNTPETRDRSKSAIDRLQNSVTDWNREEAEGYDKNAFKLSRLDPEYYYPKMDKGILSQWDRIWLTKVYGLQATARYFTFFAAIFITYIAYPKPIPEGAD
jgi:hypothetical protein